MRALLQRVFSASVSVNEKIVGKLDRAGWLVLLGVRVDDSSDDLDYLIRKTLSLRAFSDKEGKMNLDIREIEGGLLVVSQFTLYGDTSGGRRPSFTQAARGELAKAMYERYVAGLTASGLPVATGEFGAMMTINIVADGPVTLLVDSAVR